MCGIAGFWDWWNARGDEGVIARMTAVLTHRGPDDGRTWRDMRTGIALGVRRLAVLDLSESGAQPMISESGRYVLAYNGEVYNHQALRRALSSDGAAFYGNSDTEVLLAAIEHWGVRRALEQANGMFAFALWDRRDHLLTLARDRVGEKPLYYSWDGHLLLFGSEIKALRAHPGFNGTLDHHCLALYMTHGFVPAPRSIYGTVRKVNPGTFVTLGVESGFREERYWCAREVVASALEEPFRGSESRAAEEMHDALAEAVRLRMRADVPVGAFLSGGIDSSLMVALMQRYATEPVRTFTIGVPSWDSNEAPHAARVAAALGTQHGSLDMTDREAMEIIPKLPEMFDEPLGDSSQLPTYFISRFARQSVTVALTGDAADELFGGYDRYIWGPRRKRRFWNDLPTARRMLAATMRTLSPEAWSRLITVLSPVLPRYVREHGVRAHRLADALTAESPEALFTKISKHWQESKGVVLQADGLPSVLEDDALWQRLPDYTSRMMLVDLLTYLPDDILVKVDRASMSVSLETRIPFLDPRIIELAWRLPLDYKVRGSSTKWILRRVLERYLPPGLIAERKRGFSIPFGTWLRTGLRTWAEDLLSDERLRRQGIFDVEPIRRRWQQHIAGIADWQDDLFDVLMFQSWWEAQRPPVSAPSLQLSRSSNGTAHTAAAHLEAR
jgi:asparagine synthase (glutamine-hydrolysing)